MVGDRITLLAQALVFRLIPLGSPLNPRSHVFIRNKKVGHDARPIADLNDIRSITQPQIKTWKRTKNRNIPSKNRTAGLFDSRISRYARVTIGHRLKTNQGRKNHWKHW